MKAPDPWIFRPKPRRRRLYMAEAAEGLRDLRHPITGEPIELGHYPPRQVEEIVKLVMAGRAAELQYLDWNTLLSEEGRDWFSRERQAGRDLAEQMWMTLGTLPILQIILLTRLASRRYHEDASRLPDALNNAARRRCDGLLPRRAALLQALTADDPFKATSDAAEREGRGPFGWIYQAGHVPTVKTLTEIAKHRVARIVQELLRALKTGHASVSRGSIERFVGQIEKIRESEQQAVIVEKLLKEFPRDASRIDGLKLLVEWLRINCYPQDAAIRAHLDEDSLTRLRAWLGGINYDDFSKLVGAILEHDCAGRLKDEERNQLHSRRLFWSHYKTRLIRLRVLLPRHTYDGLGPDRIAAFNAGDIHLLPSGGEQVEVCIFETDTLFIAEVFRGSSSESRLYQKHQEIERLLFEERIGLDHLRAHPALRNAERSAPLDHAYLWQSHSQHSLFHHGLAPDNHIKRYRMPGRDGDWSINLDRTGRLPPPNAAKQQERNKMLTSTHNRRGWRDKLTLIEARAEMRNPQWAYLTAQLYCSAHHKP